MENPNLRFRLSIDPVTIVSDKTARFYYAIATTIAILEVGLGVGLWSFLPKEVPLFFTMPWGELRLANKAFLFILPTTSFILVIINIALNKFIHPQITLLSRLLAIGALLGNLMLIIALSGIIQSIL